uniref:Zinc metalloproteinase n=1 Tax=Strongyloides venezuelensis TaxID=75913 RepID=A0A0K0FTT4_STRVS
MVKDILITLIFFLLLSITSFSESEKIVVPDEDRNNLELTKETMNMLEGVEEIFLEKNKKYNLEKQLKKTLSDDSHLDNDNPSVKAMEETGLFEGDIMLTQNQAEDILDQVVDSAVSIGINISNSNLNDENIRRKRKIKSRASLDWEFPIKYYVESGNITLIDLALQLMENETCVRFSKQYNASFGEPGLKFFRGSGCWSYVGKETPNKFQDVSIGFGCDTIGTVQHETMHALGSTHEQCRADRNDYLYIVYNNIEINHLKNFIKLNYSDAITYNVKYDYGSNMQYHSRTFGIGDRVTMVPKNLFYMRTIGVNDGLSFLDAKLLNLHYCSKNFTNKIKCYNGGYEDPNNNTRCKCVEGYAGDRCIDLPQPNNGCNTSLYHVTPSLQTLTLVGAKNCLFHLKAPHGKKINITIVYLDAYPAFTYVCIKKNSLEIKFLEDKAQTGALFCFTNENISISSMNDHAIVHYRSTEHDNNMTLTFHTI